MDFKYFRFLFLFLVFFGLFNIGFADEQQCVQDCFNSNYNDIVDRCMEDFRDDYIETCLFDGGQYAAITQYKDECFDSYGEDYAIVYEGGMFFMSLDDFVGEVCDEFDFVCQEDMRNEYSDAAYDDMGDAAQACLEDHWDDFGDACLNDFSGPAQLNCMTDHMDEYENTCLEDYGSDEPSCGCDDDQAWAEDEGMCLDGEEIRCYVSDEFCKYDGDSWCSGFDVSYLGADYEDRASDSTCVSIDEGMCLASGGYYDSGTCIDPTGEMPQICSDEGGFWSYSTFNCYDNEEQVICLDEGNYWSIQTQTCYDDEEEGVCEELGDAYVDGVCLSDEATQCYDDGEVFCEDMGSCVIDSNSCCSDGNLYVNSLGICGESEDGANCLNDNLYWSNDLDECFDSENQKECLENDYSWNEGSEICFTSDSESDCYTYGNSWDEDEDVCVNSDLSGSDGDGRNNYESAGSGVGSNSGDDSSDGSDGENQGSLSNSGFIDASYDSSYGRHNYIFPATTSSGRFNLYNFDENEIKLGIDDRATPGKFSPDGEKFIFGIYSFKFDNSNNNLNDRRIYYDVISQDSNKNTFFGKFDIIKQNVFYQHDYLNELLLDWNKDGYVYFMSKGTNDEHSDFRVNYYDTNSNNYNRFESKRISDLQRVFDTGYTNFENGIEYFDSFYDGFKSKVNNVYEFNPAHSNQVIVSTKFESSNMEFPIGDGFRFVNLDVGNSYKDLPEFNLDNPSPSIRLPNNDFYKYSLNGDFVLTFSENSFKIVKTEKLINLMNDNSDNGENSKLYPDYILERIIKTENLGSKKITYFNFDKDFFGDENLPKGIFYSVYDSNNDKTELRYVSLETGEYFTISTIENRYVDSIEVNPKKNELLVHSCDYSNPEVLDGDYYGDPENKRFLDCKLDEIKFNRVMSDLFVMKIPMNTIPLKIYSHYFYPSNYNHLLPNLKQDYMDDLDINKILFDVDLVFKAKYLYELLDDLKFESEVNSSLNLSSKNIQLQLNTQLSIDLYDISDFRVSCGDLSSFETILSKVDNNNELIANLWFLKNMDCKNFGNLLLVKDLNCNNLDNFKKSLNDGDNEKSGGEKSQTQKIQLLNNKNKFNLEKNEFSKGINDINNIYLDINNLNILNLMNEKCELKTQINAETWFVEFSHEVFKKGDDFKSKNDETGNDGEVTNNEYKQFLMFLKENYIINIHGIRNDSTIQYMSINLKEGNLIEEDDSDAFILFEVEQMTIEDIFKSSGNVGENFFNKIVSGEIKVKKLDNRGVFESIGDWFSDMFADDDGVNGFNETFSCPEIVDFVCGVDNKTYKNGCFANEEDIKIKYEGKCEVNKNKEINLDFRAKNEGKKFN